MLISVFIVYLMAMIGLGVYYYYKSSTLSDYIVGGRQLTPAVTALSVGASDMSGWLLMGLPGAVYFSGVSQGFWIGLGLLIGAYVNWHWVARPLRQKTEKLSAITLPDYFAKINGNSKSIRIVSTVIIILFFTIYVASGVVGAGILLSSLGLGLDYQQSVCLALIVIVSYTFLGGFMAVSMTDFYQGLLMLVALLALPLMIYLTGVFDTTIIGDSLQYVEAKSSLFHSVSKENDVYRIHDVTFLYALSSMAWGLGYFGQPHILVRFMAIQSTAAIPLAKNIAMGWMFVTLLASVACGYLGIHYLGNDYYATAGLSERIFIDLSMDFFHPLFAGVVLAAIMAAVMSTIDSQLLISSSTITKDFLTDILGKKYSDKISLRIGRATVILVGLFALIIALQHDPESSGGGFTILSLVSYAWAGFGASFGPLVLCSALCDKVTEKGALAGIFMGALCVIVWPLFKTGIYELLPGFIVSLGAVYFVSMMTSPSKG